MAKKDLVDEDGLRQALRSEWITGAVAQDDVGGAQGRAVLASSSPTW
jgi:hypothetical protein